MKILTTKEIRQEEADYAEKVSGAGYFESCLSYNAELGYTWAEWADLADLAERIDFGCGFDYNGHCRGAVVAQTTPLPILQGKGCSEGWRERGCCADCAKMKGYIRKIPVEMIETVYHEFNEDDGFWRPWGCALSAEYRSGICLRHRCNDAHDAGSDEDASDFAWEGFYGLFTCAGSWERRIKPVEWVREVMQDAGLLRELQFVTIGNNSV
jgi:hypothetical protein